MSNPHLVKDFDYKKFQSNKNQPATTAPTV